MRILLVFQRVFLFSKGVSFHEFHPNKILRDRWISEIKKHKEFKGDFPDGDELLNIYCVCVVVTPPITLFCGKWNQDFFKVQTLKRVSMPMPYVFYARKEKKLLFRVSR